MTDTVPTTIQPETADEFRIIGTRVKKTDSKEKLLGLTRYAADFDVAGQLYAGLVRSPIPSAHIVSRDVTAARALPGVVGVYLGEDVPNNNVFVNVPGQNVEVAALRASSCVLATDRVRYHGEPVAIIVAETPELIRQAEQLVDIEYAELPVVTDPERALDEDAPLVHETGNLCAAWDVDTGDVDAAMAKAAVVVEERYFSHVVDHAYLEPEAGVGWLDDEGVINLRVSTQVIEHYRDVAKILGIPDAKVRIQAPYLGGGFGGKEDMTIEPYLAVAVYHTERPVKMVWSRQESLTARQKRHPAIMTYRTAADSSGRILAQDVQIVVDAGAYTLLSPHVLLLITICAIGPYRCENVRIRSRAMYTNHTPGSAFRGFGGMQAVLGYEGQLDKIAGALGMDRVEVRKRNAFEKGDRVPVGQQLETAMWLPQCIDAALAELGPKPEPSSSHHRVGLGLACNMQVYGRLVWLNDTSSAWVGYDLDGSVVVRCGVPDVGAGQVSALAQITAELLYTTIERITVHFGDSARTPLAGTTTATRQLYMSGNAVVKAATLLRHQILSGVAEATAEPVESLRLADGGVITPKGVVTIPEALAMCIRQGVPINAMDTFFAPRGDEVGQQLRSERLFPDLTIGAHAAYVEVDVETGAVRPLKYVACHDVGRAINPLSVEGQIAGAVVQGLGYAISERIVFEDCVNLTGAFFQYAIPTSHDVPDIVPVILESGEGLGPFNARGIGEPPIGPCASVIASAVEDAVGARPTQLPILAEQVLVCVDEAAEAAGNAE